MTIRLRAQAEYVLLVRLRVVGDGNVVGACCGIGIGIVRPVAATRVRASPGKVRIPECAVEAIALKFTMPEGRFILRVSDARTLRAFGDLRERRRSSDRSARKCEDPLGAKSGREREQDDTEDYE
jgi:hypothetical protein